MFYYGFGYFSYFPLYLLAILVVAIASSSVRSAYQKYSRVRNERMIELCFEGQRRDDIIRWRTAEKLMNGACYGIPIEKDGKEHILVMERRFDPSYHYLFPIPQDEIDLIGKDIMKQNPGWD